MRRARRHQGAASGSCAISKPLADRYEGRQKGNFHLRLFSRRKRRGILLTVVEEVEEGIRISRAPGSTVDNSEAGRKQAELKWLASSTAQRLVLQTRGTYLNPQAFRRQLPRTINGSCQPIVEDQPKSASFRDRRLGPRAPREKPEPFSMAL